MAHDQHDPAATFPTFAAEYGRTEEVWAELIEESGITDEATLAEWLHGEHGVSREHAVSLAKHFLEHEHLPREAPE